MKNATDLDATLKSHYIKNGMPKCCYWSTLEGEWWHVHRICSSMFVPTDFFFLRWHLKTYASCIQGGNTLFDLQRHANVFCYKVLWPQKQQGSILLTELKRPVIVQAAMGWRMVNHQRKIGIWRLHCTTQNWFFNH